LLDGSMAGSARLRGACLGLPARAGTSATVAVAMAGLSAAVATSAAGRSVHDAQHASANGKLAAAETSWPWSCSRPCSACRPRQRRPDEAPCFVRLLGRQPIRRNHGAPESARRNTGADFSQDFHASPSDSRFGAVRPLASPGVSAPLDGRTDIAKKHRSIGAGNVPQESTGICKIRPDLINTI
jgi:hypothetical protein